MRHRKKKTLIVNGVQKASLVKRTMLTNLIEHGKMTTTPKKASFLMQYTNHFFARCSRLAQRDDNKRELIRYVKQVVFWEVGRKVISDYIERYVEAKMTSFVTHVKLWQRPWDGAEKILISLI